jgi:chemotaxis protein CheX
MTAKTTFTVLQLSAALDCREAPLLLSRLGALRGQAVKLDASRVNRLSGLCLQVLLSARNTWASDNVPIVIEDPSAFFSKGWTLYGAAPFSS